MKPACCDTSFLISLYGSDAHTLRARALAGRLRQPITLSVLNHFEFENSLRLGARRGAFSQAQIAAMEADFLTDQQSGMMVVVACNLGDIVREARRMAKTQTLAHGYSTFDILLVATAIRLGAHDFLTFDTLQRTLASAERLNPLP